MNWEEVVHQLEESTARLAAVSTADFVEVAEAMNARSVAIQQLQQFADKPSSTISTELLKRIRQDLENGALVRERLKLKRSTARAEMSRLAESSCLVRTLAATGVRPRRRVDYSG